ncbi:MAG: hypothetical protein GX893_08120 [Firmicutes bacterium]|nr:hypothetical protein [Bacillota bacterium]
MKYFDEYLDKRLLKQPYIHKRTVEDLLEIDEDYQIAEIQLSQNAHFINKRLAETPIGNLGVIVLTIRRRDGSLIRAPGGAEYLREGDILLVYGRVRSLTKLIERMT